MQELYYTPDITDFRVGFECQMRDPDYQGQCDDKEWKEMSSDSDSIVQTLDAWKHFQEYRVPYLTAEQIETEGFILDNKQMTGRIEAHNYTSMSDNTSTMIDFFYYRDKKELKVYKGAGGYNGSGPDMKPIYVGSCRCINDFRLICKLLNIKP